MNAQDLKNSILQRAIEGKLVPQRKEEGTAKELLAEIRAEKAQLVKEKKIKKSKPLPEITDEEKPFDIPESWEWVRLGEIFLLQSGKNIKAENIHHEQTESYTYPCYGGNGIRGFVDFFNSEGDFPIIGRQGALCGNINRARGKFYATEHAVLTATFANTDVSWACYFLKALNLNQYATATAQPGLAVSKINYVLIPLPPLAEQYRIVNKIEELQPDIDAYDKAQTKLQAIEQRFPDAMKKSLLQYAIEGKLVPQRKEEGNAKDLLAKIRAEKAQLIKEKKIKKSKPLPAITDDEKPFDIPDSWAWCYINDVAFVTKLAGFEYTKNIHPNLVKNGIPLFKGKNIQAGYLIERFESYIPEKISDMLPRSQISSKCLLVPYVGTIGNIAIFNGKYKAHLGSNVGKIEVFNNNEIHVLEEYVLAYLKSYTGYIELTKTKKATAQSSISIDAIRKVMFPLPPLAEQHRIVAKLEELLLLCQQLASQS